MNIFYFTLIDLRLGVPMVHLTSKFPQRLTIMKEGRDQACCPSLCMKSNTEMEAFQISSLLPQERNTTTIEMLPAKICDLLGDWRLYHHLKGRRARPG
jgi:hypothetical protein